MSKAIEILNEIDKTHGLKSLVGKGLLPWSMLWYRDVYNEYDVFVKMGFKKEESKRLVEDKLKISRNTVCRAIRKMSNE